MPINTSFAGNIPWLLTEPPTAALARGAQVGEGIAHQRLAQQQINLQAAQQQELQAHRQVEEGIQKAQEARLQANATRVADMELRRGIGMQAVADDLGLFDKRNPDATDAERFAYQTKSMFKQLPNLFHTGAEAATFIDNSAKALSAMQEQPLRQEEIKARTTREKMQAAKYEADAYAADLGENVKGAATREQKLAAGLKNATDEGDPFMADVFRTALQSETVKQQNADTRIKQGNQRLTNASTELNLKLKQEGFAATPNGDGTITLTPSARPMTTGALTKSQETIQDDIGAVASLRDAIDAAQAHPEAFGVQGKFQRGVEQVKGQLNPNTSMTTPIADTQQKAAVAFSRIARSLRVDSGNMNANELAMLKQAGDTLGAEVSPQEAQMKMNNLLVLATRNTLRKLKDQLKPIPDAFLKNIPALQIESLLKDGLLDESQAKRWHQFNRVQ